MFRKVTKRFVILCNLAVAFVFLLGAFSHLFNPKQYWVLALQGLAFPYFLIVIFCFLGGWIFFKSKWAFLNIALLLVAFYPIKNLVAFHPFSKKIKIESKDSATLRVLHWNTASFGEFDKNRVQGSDKRERILNYIKESKADVLCLQEFFDSFHPEFSQNIKYISERLGYPYYFHAKDYDRYATIKSGKHIKIGHWGNIIFSKHFLIDSGKIDFPQDYTGNNESLSYITIERFNKPISIFNTHLQSIRLRKTDYESIREISNGKEGALDKSISITKKLITGYEYRKAQADVVRNTLDNFANPTIITGDFNDVPNSYTYATIKGNLQDAFLKTGFGLGRTYSHISPTLRIDYVLASKEFDIQAMQKEKTDLSDHYPLIVDFKLP